MVLDAGAEPEVAASCFHCGEPCQESRFSTAQKAFCCQGCRVVHDLLSESGLDQFYALSPKPGIPVRRQKEVHHWRFLDEPVLQQQLMDFADGSRSRVTFHVPSIHCVACVWLLENLFRLNAGIGESRVNFARREVALTFTPDRVKLSEVVALLASIGYEPSLTFGELEKAVVNPSRRQRHWLQIGFAGFAFGNIMLLSIPQYFGLDSFSGPAFTRLFGWLSLVLAFPVVTYSALDFWKSAWLSLRQRVATLDVPIALGLVAIYGQSIFEIASGTGEGYCDSLCGLIFFLLCGRAFQQRTQERMAFDRDYKSFFPLSIVRKSPGHGDDQRVSLSQLQVGDRIVVRHGEIIPADSTLAAGSALIDYSFVTGESEPVEKAAGDYLYAGGQQVGGAIEVQTVKAVSQSYLTSLWNHEAFRKTNNDLNTLANIFSRRFIWLVIGVAMASLAFWAIQGEAGRGIKAFTSVLIVACPCALALSAPFALGTAQRWLAGANTFVRNVHVLERMARVDAIVFDKTGTLTSAGAHAVRFEGAPLSSSEQQWICALAAQSSHPHSSRIHESFGAAMRIEPVSDFRETPGRGIEGIVAGHRLVAGSASWFRSQGIPLDARAVRHPSSNSGGIVHIGIDGRHRGCFQLGSELRADAGALIRTLGEGYEIALLSGDNERERERFASLFGSGARLHFNQTPLDKLGFIRRLQQAGKTVMMVGDGLNDAGALKQSDVGVAVVEKVGAFSPASDVILDARQVPQLHRLIQFSRRATRVVRFGFAISSAYNVIGIGIAAAGLLAPIVCAVLMPISSFTVVLFACGMTSWAARRSLLSSANSPSPSHLLSSKTQR